jgi:hypothetical protein
VTRLAATAPPVVLAVGQATEAVLVDDLAEFQLFDGPSDQQAYAQKSVTIGGRWDPDIGETGAYTGDETVLVERTEAGGSRRVQETTTVTCMAYSGSGDPTMAPHRAAVAAVLQVIARALRAVAEIDGTPASARLGDQQWAQVLDSQGGGVMCQFVVVVTALP